MNPDLEGLLQGLISFAFGFISCAILLYPTKKGSR